MSNDDDKVVPIRDSRDSGIHTTMTEPEDDVAGPDLTAADIEALTQILGELPELKQKPMSKEEIQAMADAHEVAKSYDVHGGTELLLNRMSELRALISKTYDELEAHLNAEWNKAVVTDDKDTQEYLIKTEAPRWMQMARSDFQVALMKLERSIVKNTEL